MRWEGVYDKHLSMPALFDKHKLKKPIRFELSVFGNHLGKDKSTQTIAENSNDNMSSDEKGEAMLTERRGLCTSPSAKQCTRVSWRQYSQPVSKAYMLCTGTVDADPEVNGGRWHYLPTATKDFRMSVEGIRQACCCVLNAAASSQNRILAN